MDTIKVVLDRISNLTKGVEEVLYPSSFVLKGIQRSLQLDNYSCGVQSVYSILKYYGKTKSIKKVGEGPGMTKNGTYKTPAIKLFRKTGYLFPFAGKQKFKISPKISLV
jgi:hypothetical protein